MLYLIFLASDITNCITRHLSNIDIWTEDYVLVSDILEQSINVGKKWNSACTHLTQLYWPNYSLHPWTGDSYTPQNLLDLVTRLEKVIMLILRQANLQFLFIIGRF